MASIGWRCRFSSCYRYKTVTVTSWAKSTPRSWAAFIWGWVCFKCVCTTGEREGRDVSISYFAGLHSTCLSISSLSCQRRHVFGLSKHYGVGVWLFSKKGGKKTFLTLAVSRMCNLKENETMSKVMPKSWHRQARRELVTCPPWGRDPTRHWEAAVAPAHLILGPGNDTHGSSN